MSIDEIVKELVVTDRVTRDQKISALECLHEIADSLGHSVTADLYRAAINTLINQTVKK